ncbi:MAG TPA: GxxExxY protein [Verrucomicrobiae bacterium]|nr:GxxExxY protein [Verrucomicrobiae bacterium]
MNTNKELIHGELVKEIVGAAFEVHNVLGYGFLEKVYENALLVELAQRNSKVEAQRSLKVKYKGAVVGDYVADLVVDDQVVVELKAEAAYNKQHEAQLLNYLKATGLRVGVLINFGRGKCEFKRLVM